MDEAESLTGLGNYEEVRAIAEELAHKVMLFPRESYYRPGGIWKKILDCWQDSGCAYLRGIGYDDLIPPESIALQQNALAENPSLMACYGNQITQYDTDITGRTFENTALSPLKRLLAIGRNPFSFICWAVKRELVLTPEFYAKTLKGAAAWEWLFHATLLGAGGQHCNTPMDASPIRREHAHTISHQYSQMTPEQKQQLHDATLALTGYDTRDAVQDWRSLDMPAFYAAQRKRLSPLLGTLINLVPRTYQMEKDT
jgi:hypothetical protein